MAAAKAADPVNVNFAYRGAWSTSGLEQEIREALRSHPSFRLVQTTADAIQITIPGAIDLRSSKSGRQYEFRAVYIRDGSRLGESLIGCEVENPQDCVRQLLADCEQLVQMTAR